MSRRGNRAHKASARAQRGGGLETPLAVPSTSQTMMGPEGEWFGPGRPLAPVAPRSVAGRRFDYMFGQNLNITPRQTERVSFQALRALADGHDLTRLAIETCKDRMVRLSWGFRIIDSDEDLTAEQDARAKSYKAMLRRPDGKRFWVDWLRMILEDLLVIDAPSVFMRRTMDQSQIVGLVQIDGATIKPVLDEWGNEPDPPETAYQQVLHGMPAVNYTSQQLIYRPRNQRVHSVYGFSPVEQIIATINIALRRQLWQHSYFTDGNIPDSLIGVPSTWTPDQIRDFQDWFDSMLSGNTARRRGGMFVPGEVAKSYVPTKDAEMFGEAETWFARVVCFCFGIPHQALVKEVNRATADSAKESAIEDGLSPVMSWVKSLMDGILMDHLGETELEFWWQNDAPVDPETVDKMWAQRVDKGAANRNEWRVAVGMQPRPEPEAEMLLYMGAAMTTADQIQQQQERQESGVFPAAIPGDGTAPDVAEQEEGGKSSGGVVAPEGKDGTASKAVSSTTITGGQPGGSVPFAQTGGPASKAAVPEDPDSLTPEQLAAFQRLSPERPAADRARRRLQATLERALGRVGARVVAAVSAVLETTSSDATKADEPDAVPVVGGAGATVTSLSLAPLQEQIIQAAIQGMGSWDFVIDGVAHALEDVAKDSVMQSVAVIGPESLSSGLVDQVSERSVRIAGDRAAELVGRRVLPSGEVIDNPDARWAITDSTRTQIRERITQVIADNEGSDALIESLQTDQAFSPARAETIARTEIAAINSDAQMETYHAAQDDGVGVKKRWLLGQRPCQICIDNAAQGAIPLERPFASGADTAPAHPRCVCAVMPEVE